MADNDVPEWATVLEKEVSAAVHAATQGAPDEASLVTGVGTDETLAHIKLLAANVERSLSKAFQKGGNP